MSKLLEGKKTYLGLIVALSGVLGLSKYIADEELTQILDLALELLGLLIAAYGRAVAKP